METILVTGANGQLGNELRRLASSLSGFNFHFATREELSISDNHSIEKFFTENKITHCINAAAYTAVDLAESERKQAIQVNGNAVGYLAKACWHAGAVFIHVSTDYVFDGNGKQPYKEDHPVSPVNFYGKTKLMGEEAAIDNNPASIIIRTSWLYSVYGKNFVKTMLRLMSEKATINVVSDQFGSPTHAADLASAIARIVQHPDAAKYAGIYHYSNSGIISWYEFAVAIRDKAGLSCIVEPIPTSEFPTPAKRPGFSAMDTSKISENFNIPILPWRESLYRCIDFLL